MHSAQRGAIKPCHPLCQHVESGNPLIELSSELRGSFMRKAQLVIVLLLAVAGALLGAPSVPVSAHPLGNFTINHYSRIELSAGRITLRYVLDMAEIPTFQEMNLIDLNHDGQADAGE